MWTKYVSSREICITFNGEPNTLQLQFMWCAKIYWCILTLVLYCVAVTRIKLCLLFNARRSRIFKNKSGGSFLSLNSIPSLKRIHRQYCLIHRSRYSSKNVFVWSFCIHYKSDKVWTVWTWWCFLCPCHVLLFSDYQQQAAAAAAAAAATTAIEFA